MSGIILRREIDVVSLRSRVLTTGNYPAGLNLSRGKLIIPAQNRFQLKNQNRSYHHNFSQNQILRNQSLISSQASLIPQNSSSKIINSLNTLNLTKLYSTSSPLNNNSGSSNAVPSSSNNNSNEKDSNQKLVNSSRSSSSLATSPSPNDQQSTRTQRIWAKFKEEASHYWHGTKLLGKEIRISAKYQMKLLKGKKLTRRERRQLKRTTSDLLRLIPFSVFLIVPFMELLLPIALRLFPNMLPSTFQVESKELEKKRKLLKVRLEMAKFLQETLKESNSSKNSKQISDEKLKQIEEFKEFFRKVRSTGEKPSTDDVVKVAKFFEDDLTLDNLSRPQLVSMCRYMNINAFGTDNFLRYTLRKRMKHLESDDRMIDSEGIESLSVSELRHACQSRGIRSMNLDEDELRKELSQWIDLHLHHGLSATLLILGRAFAFNRGGDSALESLKDALSSLPDTLLNETELEVSQETITNKQRLIVLEEQEELIADESEQEQKEEDLRKAQRELEKLQKASELEQQQQILDQINVSDVKNNNDLEDKVLEKANEMLPENSENENKNVETIVDPDSVRMTSEQLNELGEALSILSAKSSVLKEKTELKILAESNEEAAKDPENTSSSGLVKSIQKLIQQIDQQLQEYDKQVGNRMHQINIDQEGKISVGDLKKALSAIKHRPSDEAIEVLIDKLDVDHDGFVPLDHVISLAEEEGLGIVVDEESSTNEIINKGKNLRNLDHSHSSISSSDKKIGDDDRVDGVKKNPEELKENKPKKSDIVEDP